MQYSSHLCLNKKYMWLHDTFFCTELTVKQVEKKLEEDEENSDEVSLDNALAHGNYSLLFIFMFYSLIHITTHISSPISG